MPGVSLDTLPEDGLVLVLSNAGPATARACHQVCRSLRRLISANEYLQYLLALHACGYIEPLCPRTNLTYAQKTQILHDHRKRWRRKSSTVALASHELPEGKGRLEASSKGTLLWSPEGPTGFMLFQLSSRNRDTEFKQWSYRPKISDVNVAIDPDENLLAVLGRDYKIHQLTMTTQEQHPDAPAIPIQLKNKPKIFEPLSGDRIELLGQLVIGMFALDHGLERSAIVIWNRMTGQEIMLHTVPTRPDFRRDRHRAFDFLSEDVFVVCRVFDLADAKNQGFHENTLGFLDILRFDPQTSESGPAEHITTLVLPSKKTWRERSSLQVFFSSALFTLPGRRPQIWEHCPNDRVLCVSIDSDSFQEHVCVSARVLLQYATTTRSEPVPWAEWGTQAVWDEHGGLISSYYNTICTNGSRLVCAPDGGREVINITALRLGCWQGKVKLFLRFNQSVGPDSSKQREGESLDIGPLTVSSMDDENLVMFRETVSYTERGVTAQSRDLLLITR
ncbi:hypothetical protein RhiJN_21054 [Ceratobasidium sp. AG-Ba]|nr:hypothetical protein RhiJN_21054 [Ceratobasidium sp. AG-Ba]